MSNLPNITLEHAADLRRLKSCFPYRIVYCADKPDGSDWQMGAVGTMRVPNKLARSGYRVAITKAGG